MLLAFTVMREKGYLPPDVNEFISLAVMYPFCSWGSIASDLDHGKDSIPDKDPVSIAINKVLRLTGAKHRSWQTHSILVTGGFLFLLNALWVLLGVCLGTDKWSGTPGVLNANDLAILHLMIMGFTVGVISHLVLDALSTAGIHIIPGLKFRLVPPKPAFATGTSWEKGVFAVLIIGIVLLFTDIVTLEVFNFSIWDKLKLFIF